MLDIYRNLTWISAQATEWELQKKFQRINAWKHKLRESAKGDCKYIFQHLKNKARDEPANLVMDNQGNIVCNPSDAMNLISQTWDQVFGVNALHEDPVEMLRVIWPYIDHDVPAFHLPPLTGDDIYTTIQKRKVHAAPGLDGWRTSDLQALPRVCCDVIATWFNQLESMLDFDLPQVLTRAKQVILHKPGPPDPLNKRLITVLSPLILAYTGTRFRQLQHWQQEVLPMQLCGGIANRTMSSISVGLRTEIDIAVANDEHIVGIKLDQSKCFDRILPQFAAALFLAFGLPRGIVNIFVKMYQGLAKHLSYRGWVSAKAVTCANGVAQGCSFSLLAINVFMAVWVKFIHTIPHVVARVFIDDAYLWVSVQHIANLRIALQVTEQWTLLLGQKLNTAKSTLWATSKHARSLAKQAFPAIPLSCEFDVLGTKMYTSVRKSFLFPESKVDLICNDVRNIAALPVSHTTRAKLIATKVIPQCTFAADVSDVPKAALNRLQSAIVTALWHNRPHWRSKMLVFCFLAQPCLVEPTVARAYTAVRNVWRYIHAHPTTIQVLRDNFDAFMQNAHSLLFHFAQSLKVFKLGLFPDLRIGIGDIRFEILWIAPRDLKPFLYTMGQQYCYELASKKARKDFHKPTGLIDMSLSTMFRQVHKRYPDSFQLLAPHFDAQIVGCTVTNDRRCAAGFSDSALCRFCGLTKESLQHLVFECGSSPLATKDLPLHELGPNFGKLGIVEHPPAIVDTRLQVYPWDQSEQVVFCPNNPVTHLWTDGSVVLADSFWLASAAYAIVNDDAVCIECKPVFHFAITPYAAELYAILRAVARTEGPVVVHTDCQTVVDLFEEFKNLPGIPLTWSHRPWWLVLFSLWQDRRQVHCDPVLLQWQKAHICDDKPLANIVDSDAAPFGLTRHEVVCNRVADESAKRLALERAAIHPALAPKLKEAVYQRQLELTKLNQVIGLAAPKVSMFKTKEDDEPLDDLASLHRRFPTWEWSPPEEAFSWVPCSNQDIVQALEDKIGVGDARSILAFLSGLRWRVQPEDSVAYVELTFLFCARHFTLESVMAPNTTFVEVLKVVKKACSFVFHRPPQELLPGRHESTLIHKCGRAIPKGSIYGARPLFSTSELEAYGRLLLDGCGQKITSWAFDVSACVSN